MTPRQTVRDVVTICPDCGWSSTPATEAQAAYRLRRHSCDHQRKLTARAARVAARAAADGPQRECQHKNVRHQHGVRATYVLDKCRCKPCRDAHRLYETSRARRIAYGREGRLVDAQPAREHIRHLQAADMGYRRVAELAGVGRVTVQKILGGRARIDRDVAAKILAVRAGSPAPARVVDATGTQRRLQALVALGWNQNRLAERLGILPSNFTGLIRGKWPKVHCRTADAVAALYDELSMTVPPPSRSANVARTAARKAGWLPPLAWDEDTIDNPAAKPSVRDVTVVDEHAVERRMAGDDVPVSNKERREVVRRLREAGLNDLQIERRTGIAARQVLRDRQRLGLPAVVPIARGNAVQQQARRAG